MKRNIIKGIAEGEKLSKEYFRNTYLCACDFYNLIKELGKMEAAINLYYLGLSVGYKIGKKER